MPKAVRDEAAHATLAARGGEFAASPVRLTSVGTEGVREWLASCVSLVLV